jgi:hypothetical protein
MESKKTSSIRISSSFLTHGFPGGSLSTPNPVTPSWTNDAPVRTPTVGQPAMRAESPATPTARGRRQPGRHMPASDVPPQRAARGDSDRNFRDSTEAWCKSRFSTPRDAMGRFFMSLPWAFFAKTSRLFEIAKVPCFEGFPNTGLVWGESRGFEPLIPS